MPILSKLGLGRTTSPQIAPIDNLISTQSSSPRQSTQHGSLARTINPKPIENKADTALTDEPETIKPSSPSSIMSPLDLAPYGALAEPSNLYIPESTSTVTPLRIQPSPHGATRSATADLTVLREVEENEGPKGRLGHIKTTDLPPSSCPKSVWLCSKPALSPPGSPTDYVRGGRMSASRPLVIRSMSTGRLASEFDDQGRVMCLSNHCERVLKSRTPTSPAPSAYRSENDLLRSMSSQERQVKRPVIRSMTSDLFPMLLGAGGMKKQSSMSRLDRARVRKELEA
jgi:hypothetical protein